MGVNSLPETVTRQRHNCDLVTTPQPTALLFSWCETTLHLEMLRGVVVVSLWCAWSLDEGWHLCAGHRTKH